MEHRLLARDVSARRATSVSVIVPCRNERAHVRAFLDGVLAQRIPPGVAYEILVADGESDDGARAILDAFAREHPEVRVLDNRGRIVSTGLNAAIRAAKGDAIVRMDVHTEYANDYVAACLAALESSGADAVGGPWVARGRPGERVGEAIAAAFASPLIAAGGRSHDASYEGPVDTVYLGCWWRDAFDRFGLFDESLVRNQDDELNLRIVRAGGRVWQDPRIRSLYTPRASIRALARQYRQYGYWKVAVMRKHRAPASVRHVVPGAFVASLITLPLLSIAFPPVLLLFAAELVAYALVLVAGAALAARGRSRLAPLLPVVFAAYHLAYGWGWLRGVVDFYVLRRGGRAVYATLTRG